MTPGPICIDKSLLQNVKNFATGPCWLGKPPAPIWAAAAFVSPYLSSAPGVVAGIAGTVIFFHRDEDNAWQYDDDATFPVDQDAITALLEEFEALTASFVIGDVEDFDQYGLAEPALTVTVSYSTEEEDGSSVHRTAILHLGTARDSEGESVYYARVGDSKLIYEITEAYYEALTAVSYDDLRHVEMFTADFETVTGMEITLEGTVYTLNAQEVESEDEDAEVKTVWKYGETVSLVPRSNVVDLVETVNAIVLN